MIGDHPDIESALRTGFREGMDLSVEICQCCQTQIYDDANVETDCGLKVCRDCIELCDGCEEKLAVRSRSFSFAMDCENFEPYFERKVMESKYKQVSDIMIVESDDLYHSKSKDFLSSHALGDYIDSPILYHQKKLGIIPAFDSAAFSLGRAFHTMALEGKEVFDERYAVGGPVNPATEKPYGVQTNKFKEWAKEQAKPVVSFDDLTKIKGMYDGFLRSAEAALLISDGKAEGVIRTMMGGFNCQIRVDWLNIHHGIVDLKTTRCLDTFINDARAFSYLYQLAFYREVVFQATGLILPVYMVAVEKKAPFRCGVWRIPPTQLSSVIVELKNHMSALKNSITVNHWPTGYEDIRQAQLV